jgi:hypothetical protein
MNKLDTMTEPARQFIADMTAAGAPARLDGARILFDVQAFTGAYQGRTVTTGVSVSEVQSWPMLPPHWIHLPVTVTFIETNADTTDCPPGWQRHSRDFAWTNMAVPPARAWLQHVRGVLGIARHAAANAA